MAGDPRDHSAARPDAEELLGSGVRERSFAHREEGQNHGMHLSPRLRRAFGKTIALDGVGPAGREAVSSGHHGPNARARARR